MKMLSKKDAANVSAYAVRRPYCTINYKPDAHGWLKGEYCTAFGLVVVQALHKPETDGQGYCHLKMVADGVEYVFRDHTHRTRAQLVLLCSRFVNEVRQLATL